MLNKLCHNAFGDRNRDDMIKPKHYLHNIIEMISKLSNIIAKTTTLAHSYDVDHYLLIYY